MQEGNRRRVKLIICSMPLRQEPRSTPFRFPFNFFFFFYALAYLPRNGTVPCAYLNDSHDIYLTLIVPPIQLRGSTLVAPSPALMILTAPEVGLKTTLNLDEGDPPRP